MIVKTNISNLLDELAKKKKVRRISTQSICRDLKMSYTHAKMWRNDELKSMKFNSLGKSLMYFRRNGLDINFNDLFAWVEE